MREPEAEGVTLYCRTCGEHVFAWVEIECLDCAAQRRRLQREHQRDYYEDREFGGHW